MPLICFYKHIFSYLKVVDKPINNLSYSWNLFIFFIPLIGKPLSIIPIKFLQSKLLLFIFKIQNKILININFKIFFIWTSYNLSHSTCVLYTLLSHIFKIDLMSLGNFEYFIFSTRLQVFLIKGFNLL
jgi:hypothetical protein